MGALPSPPQQEPLAVIARARAGQDASAAFNGLRIWGKQGRYRDKATICVPVESHRLIAGRHDHQATHRPPSRDGSTVALLDFGGECCGTETSCTRRPNGSAEHLANDSVRPPRGARHRTRRYGPQANSRDECLPPRPLVPVNEARYVPVPMIRRPHVYSERGA